MSKKNLHCHYSGLPSPLAYIKEEKKKRNETSHTKNNVLVDNGKTKTKK